ncbi:hypothetical protein HDU87_007759 [Geranomyces variabilis]|uniref:Uncharacterized protein n=1 Tax=Geranomyces variabilis TaxID=109894 RepID=A0AAD5TG37_9FUNG|nr:hypothetical protein HDU87_007759 [Geranomyces variabilis]
MDNAPGTKPILDSMQNGTPVPLNTIEWTPKITRRPRVAAQALVALRTEIRQFRLSSVGRRFSSLNKECYRILADRSIPGQECVTILRPIINEARLAADANAPVFAENFYPSQGSSFLDEDDDGHGVYPTSMKHVAAANPNAPDFSEKLTIRPKGSSFLDEDERAAPTWVGPLNPYGLSPDPLLV